MRACGLLVAAASLGTLVACGEPRVAVAPADVVASVGVVRDTGAIPQASGPLRIRFRTGEASPSTVIVHRIERPIVVDGDDSDWAGIPGSDVPLRGPAAAIGLGAAEWDAEWRALLVASGRCADAASCEVPPADSGLATVNVRAAYDGERIWFVLRWTDSSESRGIPEWVWTPGALGGPAWLPLPAVLAGEDRAYLSFSMGSFPAFESKGCAAACHLGERLGDVSAAAWPVRTRMHTDERGQSLDGWAWRAGRTDPVGLADDLYFIEAQAADVSGVRADCPNPPTCAEFCRGPVVPVSADPPTQDVAGNVLMHPLCGAAPWLENPLAAGGAPRYAPAGGPTLSGTPLLVATAVPYDGSAPAAPAAGARLPGLLLRAPSAHRDDVAAKGRWDPATRTWTVELGRKLVTDDPNDAQFPVTVHAAAPASDGTIAPQFSVIRDRVLVPRCAGCHGPSSPPALDRAALVGKPSPQAPGGMSYVEPGDPSKSWLFLRMRGEGVAPMPPEGPVSAAALGAIETWIRNGAKDD
jgi:hypothetical protein